MNHISARGKSKEESAVKKCFRVGGGIKMGCKNVQLEMHNSRTNARLVVQVKLQSPAFKTAVLYAAQTTQ